MSFKALALLSILGASLASPFYPRALSHDDVLVLREDGPPVVMKEWDYKIEEDKRELARRKASRDQPRASPPASLLDERCEQSTEVQVTDTSDFNDWDVVMSPVIQNTGGGATVAVTKGYSIADTVTVTETVTATLESVLSVAMAIAVGTTWTTTDSLTYTFTVPAGQYGVVVSNPRVHRITGNVLSGCTDSPTTDPFTSNSYTAQASGDLAWVAGPIKLCNSSTYPVPYCVGTGTHS